MKERLPPYNPANGVRTDYETLLQKFTETESVRYEEFAAIWRDMKFSLLFAGRQDDREVQDFVDECFKIALKFCLPPHNFQIRVGGLYILYGIYCTQPTVKRRKIRVTQDIWNKILEFQSEAHQQEHLDVEFIFHKLRYHEAFQYCATESYMYPNKSDTVVDVTTREEFREEQSMFYELFSTDVLEQLAAVHQHYHHMKVALENQKNIAQGETETDMPAKSLDVIQQDLVPGITKALIHYQEKRKALKRVKKTMAETEESEGDLEEEDYSVFLRMGEGTSRQASVKNKAFKKLAKSSKSRRHRQTLGDASEKESPQKIRKRQKAPNYSLPVSMTTIQIKHVKEEKDVDDSVNNDENDEDEHEENEDNFIMSMPVLMDDLSPIPQASTAKKIQNEGNVSTRKRKTEANEAARTSTSSKRRPTSKATPVNSDLPKAKLKVKVKSGKTPGRSKR